MNEQIFGFLHGLTNKNLLVDLLIVFLAQYSFHILVLAALVMIIMEKDFKRRYYFASLTILSVIISSGIITPIVRYFYHHPRPHLVLENIKTLIIPHESFSLPSGHMMFIVPIALSIFYFNKRAGIWFLATTALMGIARTMAVVHWPLDILAGMFFGTLCFYLAKELLRLGGVNMVKEPSDYHDSQK